MGATGGRPDELRVGERRIPAASRQAKTCRVLSARAVQVL
jgi:hypothetical protein